MAAFDFVFVVLLFFNFDRTFASCFVVYCCIWDSMQSPVKNVYTSVKNKQTSQPYNSTVLTVNISTAATFRLA